MAKRSPWTPRAFAQQRAPLLLASEQIVQQMLRSPQVQQPPQTPPPRTNIPSHTFTASPRTAVYTAPSTSSPAPVRIYADAIQQAQQVQLTTNYQQQQTQQAQPSRAGSNDLVAALDQQRAARASTAPMSSPRQIYHSQQHAAQPQRHEEASLLLPPPHQQQQQHHVQYAQPISGTHSPSSSNSWPEGRTPSEPRESDSREASPSPTRYGKPPLHPFERDRAPSASTGGYDRDMITPVSTMSDTISRNMTPTMSPMPQRSDVPTPHAAGGADGESLDEPSAAKLGQMQATLDAALTAKLRAESALTAVTTELQSERGQAAILEAHWAKVTASHQAQPQEDVDLPAIRRALQMEASKANALQAEVTSLRVTTIQQQKNLEQAHELWEQAELQVKTERDLRIKLERQLAQLASSRGADYRDLADVAAANEELGHMNEEVRFLQHALEEERAVTKHLRDDMAVAQAAQISAETGQHALRQQVDVLRAEAEAQSKLLIDSQAAKSTLQDELEALRVKLLQQDQTQQDADSSTDVVELTKRTELEAQISHLRTDLAQTSAALVSSQQEVTWLTREGQQRDLELKRLQAVHAQAEQSITQAAQVATASVAIQQTLEETRAQLSEMEVAYTEARNEAVELRQQLTALHATATAQQLNSAAPNQRETALQSQIEFLQSELAHEKSKSDSTVAELKKLNEDNQAREAVRIWLTSLDMQSYFADFEEWGIRLPELLSMTDERLEEIGILNAEDRGIILTAVIRFRETVAARRRTPSIPNAGTPQIAADGTASSPVAAVKT
eukprot:TRINITY_DN2793_c0_g1_i2.p1 TRINITY_DN2793_c0_g1~~TRINITY_DN2793_c0_g1_i2.p1  ORF type:complete len:903 (+),score=245.42 TRINITY_DN2793_c0_g1_i2:340-2709(+)